MHFAGLRSVASTWPAHGMDSYPPPLLRLPSQDGGLHGTRKVFKGCRRPELNQNGSRMASAQKRALRPAELTVASTSIEGAEPIAPKHVVCLGDSLTNCSYSADWVQPLSSTLRHQGVALHRHGINGEMACRALRRVGRVFNSHPDPVAVIIWLGTNDVIARTTNAFQIFQKVYNSPPQDPSLQLYSASMSSILDIVAEKAPNAKVVMISLPPLTEDLGGQCNQLVAEYCAELRALAEARPNITLVDFNRSCMSVLEEEHSSGFKSTIRGLNFFRMCWWTAIQTFQYYVMRKSWDAIAKSRGLYLLTDEIHLNERAVSILLPLLSNALNDV